MSQPKSKSVQQVEQKLGIDARIAVKRLTGFNLVATVVAALAVLVVAAVYAQDEHSAQERTVR
jgi:hypothetical protein